MIVFHPIFMQSSYNNGKHKDINLFCGFGRFRLTMKDKNCEYVFSGDNDNLPKSQIIQKLKIPLGDIK